MREPIYFSKFMITNDRVTKIARLLCNVVAKELSYQVCVPIIVRDAMGESRYEVIIHERKVNLTDEDVDNLKPYINAWDFEPYRNKRVFEDADMGGEQCILRAWDDYFEAFTDSYLSYLNLSMNYKHYTKWPTEKLEDYINETFVKTGRLQIWKGLKNRKKSKVRKK